MSGGYDAVLLLGFGGPEGEAEVLPFLERVTAGRGIPTDRLREVGQHYFALGGVSPLNEQNRQLRQALATALDAQLGAPVPVQLAHRNSAPFVAEVLAELADAGHRRILAVATSAYAGYSGCRQYREDLGLATQQAGLAVSVRKLPPFYDLPGFSTAIAELLHAAIGLDVDLAADTTRLMFTTHSIPTALAASSGVSGDAYLTQHRWVAEQVCSHLSAATGITKPWRLAFQSRSGPPHVPWLEPDVNDALAEEARDGAQTVILVPIGFLSDHMEVIWDLDTEAARTAADLGVRLIRTPTVGTHPRFVEDLADCIAAELRNGPTLAAPGDPCFGECCHNPRSQAPVEEACRTESPVMEG